MEVIEKVKKEEEACILLKNLILESQMLNKYEEDVIIEELNLMQKNSDYRALCHFNFPNAMRFLSLAYDNLGDVISGMFTWDRTHSGHRFWLTLSERFRGEYDEFEDEEYEVDIDF